MNVVILRSKVVVIAAALALLVFLVLPGSLYLGNIGEFMTAPGPIARLLLIPALLFLAAVMLGLRLSRRLDFSRVASMLAALTLLVWIQSYLLVWDYGRLDGSPIDWNTPAWRGWVDLSAWIAVLAAAVVFHRRLEQPLSTAAFAIVALQIAVLVSDGYARRDALTLKPSQRAASNSLEPMARFSPERNVLHIVLDSFQGDVFKDIVNGPAGPHFRQALGGFTYFEEHLGTFPGTYFSLPVMLTGQVFRNHMPRPEFIEQAFGGNSILNAAHDAGFEVDISSEAMMLDMLMLGHFDNAYLTSRPSLVEEAAKVLDLALFRLAPHWLKPLVYNEQRWLTQRLVSTSGPMGFFYFTHNSFLADVTRRLVTDRKAPVYKFFHLMTTHPPFVVNPDCSYAGGVLVRDRETVTAQSQCSLAFVVSLLDRMKAAGIYDSSLIVIMGDHGGHIPPHRYRHGTVVERDYEYDLTPWFVGLATPLMAIKPPGSTHPFEISSALTSMTDTAATIASLLKLDARLPGTSLMDETGEQAGERRFYGYAWDRKAPAGDYVGTIQEYTVNGSAYRSDSWHLGTTHPTPPAR